MLNTIDGPSEPVEDYLCDPEEMPLGARESRLPCPEDCVLNDWGPWSRCSLVRAESKSWSGSCAIWQSRNGNVRLLPGLLRFILISFSCQKYFLWGSRNSKHSWILFLRAVCFFVNRLFLVHRGGVKMEKWNRKPEKKYHLLYITL